MTHLYGPAYVLGEDEAGYASIPDLPARAERFRMAPDPGLWGWGSVFRTGRTLADLAIDSGAATLRAAAIDPLSIDALVLCCTGTPGPPETHGRFVSTVVTGIGLGDVAFYGLGMNRCVGLLAGVDLADALVATGRYRRVLVVTTDRVEDEADRMASYALFSDGAASCVVAAGAAGPGGYEVVACASAQDTASLDWSSEISADLARRVNDRILAPLGMKVGDVSGLMHSNIYKPLVVMKERQAGFESHR